jgi:hypothetical protein
MKNKFKKILPFILAFVFVGMLGWGAFILGKSSLAWFGGLQKEVAAAILAALTAVAISILSLVLSKYYERRAEVRKEHREKKVPIYEKSIEFWFKVLMSEKSGRKPPSEQEVIQFLQDFTQELIVWGSDSVLKAFTTFRETLISYKGSTAPIQGMLLFEQYLFEIRKDLGHKNKNLHKGDILALFINDIRQYTDTISGAQQPPAPDRQEKSSAAR